MYKAKEREMPIKKLKKSVKKATTNIRHRWSRDEKQRRQQMADLMQTQLLTALGFVPAPIVEK